MAGLRIEIDGAETTLEAIRESIRKAADPKGLYDAIGASLSNSAKLRFQTESGPDDNPWPPSLRALVRGGRTLTDTARLVDSITHEASASGVAIGTNVIYAAIHRPGGAIRAKTPKGLRFRSAGGGWVTRREATIPARPFLGLGRDDEAAISAAVAKWFGAGDDAGR